MDKHEPTRQAIGAKIRHYRTESGMTQTELAHSVGLETATAVSLIESGKRGLLVHVAVRICTTLNIKIEDLLTAPKSPLSNKDH